MTTQLEELSDRVQRKLKDVPPDRLLHAPPTIVGPTALQYALLGGGDDVSALREMFENLLVTSMDRESAAKAHPAFAGMISQMTPDEAWILKSITRSEYAALQVHDYQGPSGDGHSYGVWSTLGRGAGVDESRLPEYIANLARIGILAVDAMSSSADRGSYEQLDRVVKGGVPEPYEAGRLTLAHVRVYVTQIGAQFLEACVGVKVSPARYGM